MLFSGAGRSVYRYHIKVYNVSVHHPCFSYGIISTAIGLLVPIGQDDFGVVNQVVVPVMEAPFAVIFPENDRFIGSFHYPVV